MKQPYKPAFSERVILPTLLGLIVLLWFTGQMSLISALIIASTASFFLMHLSFRRRLDAIILRNQSKELAERSSEKGIVSVRSAALNSLPTPVLIVDRDTSILLANDASRDILGNDIVGENALMYLRQPNTIDALHRAIKTGQVNQSDVDDGKDLRYTTTDDRSFDLAFAPIRDKGNRSGYQVIVFFYEVTTLLRSEQMRVDFVANASHELRTPLTSLIGSIETLQGPAKDDPVGQERFLSIMQRESERMIRLIDDLLSLSRIEMSRYQTPQQVVDIQLAIRNTVHSVEATANKRGIRFDLDLDDSASFVIADGDQITQVLVNLIFNGAKYADENTTIHVTTERSGTTSDLILIIRDEGPGISSEHLGRLTERFYRVDTARSRKMGGTGLGLAIVKHILLRHRSQLEIKSRVGEGTQFSFRLPLAESKASTPHLAAPLPPPTSRKQSETPDHVSADGAASGNMSSNCHNQTLSAEP